MKVKNDGIALALFILLCLLVQAISSAFTFSSVNDWYPTIVKPSWNPPGWVFGPVWTFLYLSMAISAWLVWLQRDSNNIKKAMFFFAIQLVLNILWTAIFFGMQNISLAFFEILLLWLGILFTTVEFWRIKPVAGILFIPYLVWVGYAAALNFAIWQLNP